MVIDIDKNYSGELRLAHDLLRLAHDLLRRAHGLMGLDGVAR